MQEENNKLNPVLQRKDQRKDAEATERGSARDAQGGQCLDWAGPWLGFPGRSHCTRVRGTGLSWSCAPCPPFSFGELQQLLILKYTMDSNTSSDQLPWGPLAFVLGVVLGEGTGTVWLIIATTCQACSGCPEQVTAPLSLPRGHEMASISWGVEKPVSMSTCAKHCKCVTETTSFLGKQTELLFPPDLSWPAILQ